MQVPTSPRLFLVDGYALIYRAFYALISRPLRTSRGENTSAVWGIANFLQRMMKNHAPEYIGWVHDSGLSFRHETYPGYKATREKLTDELQADFDTGIDRITQLLAAYRIPVITVGGYEADDVIGTLARQAADQGVNVVIISGDKDFQQLVRERVWLLNPGRGGPAAVEEHWVSTENAEERLGVHPRYVTDYLALLGDTSDNVPGVPGIGEKTARELIGRYGDIEGILAHADEITKKRPREALMAGAANARLSKELVTIRDDLPVQLDLEAMKTGDPDSARLRDLYVELEFHGMAREIAESPEPVATSALPPQHYRTVENGEELQQLVQTARNAGLISLSTMTVAALAGGASGDPLRSRLVGLSIATSPGEAYYLPLAHTGRIDAEVDLLAEVSGQATIEGLAPRTRTRSPSAPQSIAARMLAEGVAAAHNLPSLEATEMRPLRELLEDARIPKVSQDAKHDTLVLRRAGIHLAGVVGDTMIASYLLDPGRRAHDLTVLAMEFLGQRMTSFEELCGKGKDAISFDRCPVPAARDYACADADMTFQIWQAFEPQLRDHRLESLLQEIELPLVEVLAEVEWTGISIDLGWFRSLKEKFQRERELVMQEIYRTAGGEFNINSNLQLREILFGKLGLPVTKRTSTGPSTDASVLQQFAEAGHRLPALILEYRELSKLESTYLDTLPSLVNPETGRLHTSFNQTVASTGRLSSSDPNLQNIPIRRELGRAIRRGFIPRAGWTMIAADYSQIELRLLAHLSNDPAFVTAFRADGDIHRQTAAVIFGVDARDVTSEMRGRAKTINFATIYGQGPHALSQQLGIEYAEARQFIATYFERFRGIRDYLDSRMEFARENGYVETIFGRRRYIPEIRDKNFNVRAFGERTAANSPIQGSAADLIKVAMIRIDAAIRQMKLKGRMLLQVHDELVFEAPPEEVDALVDMVKTQMENAAPLSVPLVVDVGMGSNWLETKSGR